MEDGKPKRSPSYSVRMRQLERERRILSRKLLAIAISYLLSDDFEAAREIIRDMIRDDVGYATASEDLGIPEKSLIRMFGPSGNPQAKNLLAVIALIQRHHDFKLTVK